MKKIFLTEKDGIPCGIIFLCFNQNIYHHAIKGTRCLLSLAKFLLTITANYVQFKISECMN